MKNNKKAFTIVELVIVIAVIAILAAVLIPTFSNLIQKSKVSADQQLIRNLNTALTTDAAVTGKHVNMQSALDAAFESGYDVGKINATATGNEILWDQVNDVFCYLDGDEIKYIPNSVETGLTKNDYRLWVISDKINQNYSTYYTGTETTINTAKGFDAGKSAVSTINYTNTGDAQKDVIIRTTTGTLTINAEKDTVHHYGEGLVLTIDAIEGNSYHEHGYFPKASISMGRLVVEEGNIPSVEIASKDNTIKIESNKDIVVSASQAVVEALGSNLLANVEVKVTNASANVVVDEKIDSAKVDAEGKTPADLVSITKVATLEQLLGALSAKAEYILFTDNIHTNGSDLININYPMTLDGNGKTLDGNGGLRGSVKQMICIGYNAPERVKKVVVKNINIETTSVFRPLDCRGNTDEIVFDSINMVASGPESNDQGFTYGGNENTLLKLTVTNCNLAVGSNGYTFIFFNPVDLAIEKSTITGWAGLYFKCPSSSHGSRGSKVEINNSAFICHNVYSNGNNDFGAIVFEDGSIDVAIKNSSIDVTREGTNAQAAVLFSSSWAARFGVTLKECKVRMENTVIMGTINDESIEYDLSNNVMIHSGKTTLDPASYLPAESTSQFDGVFYNIKNLIFIE